MIQSVAMHFGMPLSQREKRLTEHLTAIDESLEALRGLQGADTNGARDKLPPAVDTYTRVSQVTVVKAPTWRNWFRKALVSGSPLTSQDLKDRADELFTETIKPLQALFDVIVNTVRQLPTSKDTREVITAIDQNTQEQTPIPDRLGKALSAILADKVEKNAAGIPAPPGNNP